MASVQAQRGWVVVSVALIAALMAHSLHEYVTHLSGALPFTHRAVGIGRVEEGDFAPTDEGIPPEGLPWVLDSSAGWSPDERAEAAQPCGLLALCARRYPRWCAAPWRDAEPVCARGGDVAALEQAGVLDPRSGFGAALWIAPGPRLVLERSQGLELALDAGGLAVRQVAP